MPIPALEYASRLRVRLAASTALPIHHQRAPGLASVVTSGHAIFCAESEAARLGMKIDMNTGTGWPFGGPEVGIEDAACKLLIEEYTLKGGERLKEKIEVADEKQRPYAKLCKLMAFRVLTDASTSKEQKAVRCYDLTSKIENGKLVWKAPKGEWRLIAAFVGKTFQKVKRAAPGGEGYVMNHFSAKAVSNYLNRFERAFAGKATDGSAGTPTEYPHNFFNDSYEVYGADWTDDLFEQFARRRGYKLEHFFPDFLSKDRTEITRRIKIYQITGRTVCLVTGT